MKINLSAQFKISGLLIALLLTLSLILSYNIIVSTTKETRTHQQNEHNKTLKTITQASQHFDKMVYWLTQMTILQTDNSVDKAKAEKDLLTNHIEKIKVFSPKEADQIEKIIPNIEEIYLNALNAFFDNKFDEGKEILASAQPLIDSITQTFNDLNQRTELQYNVAIKNSSKDSLISKYIINGGLVTAIIMCCTTIGIALFYMTFPINRLNRIMHHIIKGNYNDVMPYQNRKDEIGMMALSLMNIKDFVDSSISLQSALDTTGSNIIMMDNDMNISYLNQSAINMLNSAAYDIKQTIPDFDLNQLVGKPLNHLTGNSYHITEGFKGNITIGEHIFHLKTHVVLDRMDNKLNIISEWKDVTLELHEAEEIRKIEEEIDKVVAAVQEGNFTKKLPTQSREGFLLTISQNINDILETFNSGLSETNLVLNALSNGNLSTKMKGQYKGIFNDFKESINSTIVQLNNFEKEIEQLKHTTQRGDFTYHLNSNNKMYCLEQISNNLNSITTDHNTALSDISNAVLSLSKGDLHARINGMYQGTFHKIKTDFNNSLDQINTTLNDITHSTDIMQSGMFSCQTNTQDKLGFHKIISLKLNQINEQYATNFRQFHIALESIANGTLNGELRGDYQGCFFEIQESINSITRKLKIMVSDIKDHTQNVCKSDFSMPITTNEKAGFYYEIIEKLNQTNAVCDAQLKEINSVLRALSSGELRTSITGNYKGAFTELKHNINKTIQQLDYVMEATNKSSFAARNGDYSYSIETDAANGCYRNICDNMNDINEVTSEGLHNLTDVLRDLSNGSLDTHFDGHYQGVFKDIKNEFNSIIQRLKEMVVQIIENSYYVSNAAHEISEGTEDLSSRTKKQVSTILNTNTSTQNLVSTTLRNTQSTQKAGKHTKDVQRIATKAEQTVSDTMVAMNHIQDSSRKISKIIMVIDDIAFKTNLIAMSASVEAESAGELGKGFTIVADEVRKLACSSAEAAHEIRELINTNVKEIENGSQLVEGSKKTIQDIIQSIKIVSGLIDNIATENDHQSHGISSISDSIKEVDHTTQQNTVIVEQNNAATHVIQEKADELINLSQLFSLDKIKPQ